MDIGTSEDHDYGHLSDEEWSGQRLHTPSQSKGGQLLTKLERVKSTRRFSG